MENLYKKYKDSGFTVLAFPCNQFKNQEPKTNKEIKVFVREKIGANYPLFEKIEVNGKNEIPIYSFLKSKKGGILGNKIKWNFTKFLVNKEGKVVSRFAPMTKPEDIEKKIVELLK